jgi:hypothetical protein
VNAREQVLRHTGEVARGEDDTRQGINHILLRLVPHAAPTRNARHPNEAAPAHPPAHDRVRDCTAVNGMHTPARRPAPAAHHNRDKAAVSMRSNTALSAPTRAPPVNHRRGAEDEAGNRTKTSGPQP